MMPVSVTEWCSASLARTFVLLWPERSVEDPGEFVTEFSNWLRRHDEIFKKYVFKSERLDLLYHRSLSIVAAGAKLTANLAKDLCPLARELGIAPTVHAMIVDFAADIDSIRRLAHFCSPGTIVLDALDAETSSASSEGRALANAVFDEGASLSIAGPPQYWRSTGIFAATTFNARQPAVVFQDISRLPAAKRSYNLTGTKNPCLHRLGLFITHDGLIYACQGLVGTKSFAIGNIRSDYLADSVGGEDLNELARNGPKFDSEPPAAPAEAHAICKLHKMQLEARVHSR